MISTIALCWYSLGWAVCGVRKTNWWKNFARDTYSAGEIVPWWKGFVADDFCRREYIVAPLGFHLIYSILAEIFFCFRRARAGAHRFEREQQYLWRRK